LNRTDLCPEPVGKFLPSAEAAHLCGGLGHAPCVSANTPVERRPPLLSGRVVRFDAWAIRTGEWQDPAEGEDWGELHLRTATPDAGSEWTDDGSSRERRQLKHRADGDSRVVPIHPELTRLLRQHLTEFGTGPDGRLFSGVRGGELPTITYRRAWIKARQVALTAAEQASPLARRPYDLRHACLSTWLNGGVYPTQVAEWAGHGVDVLLRIYAKCIAGQDELAKRRISEALRQD
jgi:hypothetical protein